jgi:carboxymethylenebutenolidase
MGARITFQCNGTTTDGYLARPATGRGPGLIVIQEWWGLVPQIERVADRFAGEGFVALAPDLYHGQSTKSPDEAGKLMMALRSEDAARDLAAAIDHLVEQPEVSAKKVGTIGFCMGGALSLFAASRNPEVGACVVFYGGHPNIKPDLASLTAPVLGIYAGRDTFVSPAVVAALDQELTALGKRHAFHTYADAPHGFFNEARPEVYDAVASADAWAKTLAFFRRELGA